MNYDIGNLILNVIYSFKNHLYFFCKYSLNNYYVDNSSKDNIVNEIVTTLFPNGYYILEIESELYNFQLFC